MKRIRAAIIVLLARIAGYVPDRLKDRWVAGAATGVGLTGLGASSLLSALGFNAVLHSSSAYILTGSGGYIAGTYGFAWVVSWFMWLPMLIALSLCTIVGGVVYVSQKLRAKK